MIACVFIIFVISVCISVDRNVELRMQGLPKMFLWAWERPEDLRSLRREVGVAYLAATLRISSGKLITLPRMQPLLVAPNVPLISVFRIETDQHERSKLTADLARQITIKITRFANLSRTRAVQVDFDARLDEREFYKRLLDDLRAQLPAQEGLSITALVSWCMCDNWMQKLPIDESVPMYFSMGNQTHNVLTDIDMDRRFGDKRCEAALGISLDEPAVNRVVIPHSLKKRADARVYVFSSKRWTSTSMNRAIDLIGGRLLVREPSDIPLLRQARRENPR